jgi:hypothetical protein
MDYVKVEEFFRTNYDLKKAKKDKNYVDFKEDFTSYEKKFIIVEEPPFKELLAAVLKVTDKKMREFIINTILRSRTEFFTFNFLESRRYNFCVDPKKGRYTISEVEKLFNNKAIPKLFLRTNFAYIDFETPEKLADYVLRGRVDIFRAIGKQGMNFTSKQLEAFLSLSNFFSTSTTGLLGAPGSSDNICKANIRTLLKYQTDQVTRNMFFTIFNNIQDENDKQYFIGRARAYLLGKVDLHPDVEVLLRLY